MNQTVQDNWLLPLRFVTVYEILTFNRASSARLTSQCLTWPLSMNLRAKHFGAEEVDLSKIEFTKDLLRSVPGDIARRLQVLPLFVSPTLVKVVIGDPADLNALDCLRILFGREIEICVAEVDQLRNYIHMLYGAE